MPIDSQNKRRSTHVVKAASRILPVPDSAIGAADRAHLWLYSGIAIAGGAAAAAVVNVAAQHLAQRPPRTDPKRLRARIHRRPH